MANAKRCDVTGKYYEPTNSHQKYVILEADRPFQIPSETRMLDLCPEAYESLKAFVAGDIKIKKHPKIETEDKVIPVPDETISLDDLPEEDNKRVRPDVSIRMKRAKEIFSKGGISFGDAIRQASKDMEAEKLAADNAQMQRWKVKDQDPVQKCKMCDEPLDPNEKTICGNVCAACLNSCNSP